MALRQPVVVADDAVAEHESVEAVRPAEQPPGELDRGVADGRRIDREHRRARLRRRRRRRRGRHRARHAARRRDVGHADERLRVEVADEGAAVLVIAALPLDAERVEARVVRRDPLRQPAQPAVTLQRVFQQVDLQPTVELEERAFAERPQLVAAQVDRSERALEAREGPLAVQLAQRIAAQVDGRQSGPAGERAGRQAHQRVLGEQQLAQVGERLDRRPAGGAEGDAAQAEVAQRVLEATEHGRVGQRRRQRRLRVEVQRLQRAELREGAGRDLAQLVRLQAELLEAGEAGQHRRRQPLDLVGTQVEALKVLHAGEDVGIERRQLVVADVEPAQRREAAHRFQVEQLAEREAEHAQRRPAALEAALVHRRDDVLREVELGEVSQRPSRHLPDEVLPEVEDAQRGEGREGRRHRLQVVVAQVEGGQGVHLRPHVGRCQLAQRAGRQREAVQLRERGEGASRQGEVPAPDHRQGAQPGEPGEGARREERSGREAQQQLLEARLEPRERVVRHEAHAIVAQIELAHRNVVEHARRQVRDVVAREEERIVAHLVVAGERRQRAQLARAALDDGDAVGVLLAVAVDVHALGARDVRQARAQQRAQPHARHHAPCRHNTSHQRAAVTVTDGSVRRAIPYST